MKKRKTTTGLGIITLAICIVLTPLIMDHAHGGETVMHPVSLPVNDSPPAMNFMDHSKPTGIVIDLIVAITALVIVAMLVREIRRRRRTEATLLKSRELLNRQQEDLQIILDNVPAWIYYKDRENRYVRVNKLFADTMGMSKEQLEGKSLFDIFPREQAEAFWSDDKEVIKFNKPKTGIIEPVNTPGGMLWAQTDKIPCYDIQGNIIGITGFTVDITERKLAEEEWEKLILELQKALSEVKLLSGLLPICSSCKKIRNDKGYWEQIECYIGDHSEAEFSHSICPDCAERLYPGISSKKSG